MTKQGTAWTSKWCLVVLIRKKIMPDSATIKITTALQQLNTMNKSSVDGGNPKHYTKDTNQTEFYTVSNNNYILSMHG